MRVPFVEPPRYSPDLTSSKFAAQVCVNPRESVSCRVALIGLADDLGMRLNHGRPGAKGGPTAFRAALEKYGVSDPPGWQWPRVFDAGDVIAAEGETAASLEETHRRVTEAVSAIVDAGLFPIAIGGGHDLTFPFVRAVAHKFGTLGGLYFDAHLDVRETAGSGMPFRRLIEVCGVRPLIVRGLSPYANSAAHVAWFKEHGGKIDGWGPGRFDQPGRSCEQYFASFDLDVLDSAFAPGVSALNPCGWDVQTAEKGVVAIASDPRLKCFDLMELNPAFDEQGRTARVAVRLFLAMLRGLAGRFAAETGTDPAQEPVPESPE